MYISNIIKYYFDSLNLKNSIISRNEMNENMNSKNIIYFITNLHNIKEFPSMYIYYQIELISDINNKSLINIINNAYQYWDFSNLMKVYGQLRYYI